MIEAYFKGIDISEWQGDFDLRPYQDQFVIIRAGYWDREDLQFRANIRKAQELGMPFGVYWFSESLTDGTAVYEAEACLKVLGDIRPDMGVWLDMENSNYKDANGFNAAENAGRICKAFCEKIQLSGYYTGVYCSKSWLKYIQEDCKQYDKWVASWGSNDGQINDDTSDIGSLLQYTSKLDGGSLDGDISFVSIDHYDPDRKPVQLVNRIDHKQLISCLAYLTISGIFGNSEDRRECLGSIYDEVQMEVNAIYENK